MLTINLLPPQQRLARETKESTRKLIFSFIFLFIILTSSWILLFTLRQILQQTLNSQNNELAGYEQYFNQENNKKIQQEIENINKTLSRVSTIEKNKSIFSKPLIELTKITPPEIYFYNIKLDKNEKKLIISGFAKTRTDVLKFQDNLEKSKDFENILSPSSNIINPENINFSMEAKLTNYK